MTNDRQIEAGQTGQISQTTQAGGAVPQTVPDPETANADVYYALPDCEERRVFETGHCFTPEDLQAQINEFLVGNVLGASVPKQEEPAATPHEEHVVPMQNIELDPEHPAEHHEDFDTAA